MWKLNSVSFFLKQSKMKLCIACFIYFDAKSISCTSKAM